ncbi:MAG: hypothetical protein ACLQG3_00800 [Terracidiphilus sp.]
MKIMKGTRVLLLIGLVVGSATGARAAGTYTLTCNASRSGAFSITLTGFNMVVTGSGDASGASAAAGKRDAKFELTVQFNSGKDYGALLSMLEDNENLRSCKLVDGESEGAAATDNWNQMSVTKGKNKSKTSEPASTTRGALEWILTNASITSVTATGSESTTGAPQGSMQATIEAQTFSFAD